ncbi:MAG: phosphotransferase family protein [Actinomycetes bacterium]
MNKYALSDRPECGESVEPPVPVSLLQTFGASVAEHVSGLGAGAWVLTGRDGEDVVATTASPAAVEMARAAADVFVGPRVLGAMDGWLVCERLYGSHLTSLELRRPPVLDELATMFARLHSATVALPTASMLDSLRRYADEAGSSLDVRVAEAVAWADDVLTDLTAHTMRRVPCHLDVAANVIATDHGMRFIDFDFAAFADPAQELGQLLWEAELDERGAVRLIDGYARQTGLEVAESATWCLVAGVTWTLWASSPKRAKMARYSRRSGERLVRHWAWRERGPCG